MRSTDSDIVDWLEQQDNKQGAVKTAIRYYLDHTGYKGDNKEDTQQG